MGENLGELAWYAIRVKPKYEKRVSIALRGKGYEEFLPTYKVKRRYSKSTRREVENPLFPGYVFCRLDAQFRLPILTTPGVLHFVGYSGRPEPIDSIEIESVRRCVKTISTAEPWTFVKAGSKVRIEEGPLQGAEGILLSTKGESRLVVSITILSRSVAVTIDRDWVADIPVDGESLRRAQRAA